jgi:uncharacterized membrane protein YfcA
MVLPTLALFIMVFTSLFTSALSAATGMGGGVLLFTVMTLYFPMGTLIPIHGVIQFFNNFFILVFLKGHLKKTLLKPFLIGSVFGILAGAFLVSRIIQTPVPQIIIVMLGSSVCGQISIQELSYAADLIQSRNFRAFEAFLVATGAYLLLSVATRSLLNWAGPRFLFGGLPATTSATKTGPEF